MYTHALTYLCAIHKYTHMHIYTNNTYAHMHTYKYIHIKIYARRQIPIEPDNPSYSGG